MRRGSETQLIKAILDYLWTRKINAWRTNQGAMVVDQPGRARRFVRFSAKSGISDIIGFLPDGRFLAIEGKICPNRPTPEQAKFLQEVKGDGGVAILAYSVQEVMDVVEQTLKNSLQPSTGVVYEGRAGQVRPAPGAPKSYRGPSRFNPDRED